MSPSPASWPAVAPEPDVHSIDRACTALLAACAESAPDMGGEG